MALFTLIWLFPGVHTHVPDKFRGPTELLEAHLTLRLPLADVPVEVLQQLGPVGELVSALCAAEALVAATGGSGTSGTSGPEGEAVLDAQL